MARSERAGFKPPSPSAPVGLWARWRRLIRLFPTWTVPITSLADPGAMTMLGTDMATGLRRNRSTERAKTLLSDCSPADLAALTGVAELNQKRQDGVSRSVLLLYLTLPLTIAAAGADIAPDVVTRWAKANAETVVILAVGATLSALHYQMSAWRARQIVSVLELVRIERALEDDRFTPPAA